MKKMPAILLSCAVLLAPVLLLAQDMTPEATELAPGPDLITMPQPGLMPEGIAYDPVNDTLLVGSLSQGTIFQVADDGTLTPLTDSENLAVSAGLEVDAERNRVLAAGSGPNQNSALVGAFDLTTGEELFVTDLGALVEDGENFFANDLAVDADGNAYITDSAAGVIYKVDVDGTPSIFVQDDSFVGQFILNGIAYNPDGYLVAVRNPGLIKIPLDDPTAFTEVEADGNVSGGDGIIFSDADTLVIVSGRQGRVIRLESSDDFATASITGEYATQPISATTAAVRGDEVYVVYARFTEPMATEYPIEKVTFTDIEAAE
jgi:sugar lactone lactonase YvrE